LNKSLDISRNKSNCFPLKPNFYLKSEINPTSFNSNNNCFSFIHDYKNQEFNSNDSQKLNKLLFNSHNITSLIDDPITSLFPQDKMVSNTKSSKLVYLLLLLLDCN